MIILEQNTVRKIISVIASAPYTYRIFLKHTAVRCGLSGIQKCHFASFKKFGNLAGVSSDTAHSLKVIQSHSFSGKQYTNVSVYCSKKITLFHCISIFEIKMNFCFLIQDLEYSCIHIQSGNDSIFLCDKIYSSFDCTAHHRICGNILTCNILLKCHTN